MANEFKVKNGIIVVGPSQLRGSLQLYDADSSNYVALQSPTTVSPNITFTLPGTDGTNGQVLTTNGSGVLSFTTVSGSGATTLDGLSDVTIATLTAGQILRYNGTVWQNAEEVNTISELADVDFASSGPPVNGDVLIYDGTSWFPTPDITTGVQDYLSNVATPLARQTGTTLVPISVGTTAPSSPSAGDLWVDTN